MLIQENLSVQEKLKTVSYTHLDVYKRQPVYFVRPVFVLAQGGSIHLPVYLLGKISAHGTDNLLCLIRADRHIPVLLSLIHI